MADFEYLAIDPDGRERRGHVTATTLTHAEAQLVRRKFFVVKVEPGRQRLASGRSLLSFRREHLAPRQLALFTRQLTTLAEVSPLEEALRTIRLQTEHEGARAVIGRVHDSVVAGHRLSDALRHEGKSFPPLYCSMIAAGESSGSLSAILARLAALLERQEEVRSKLFTALAYPLAIATVAVLVIVAMMIFVVPRVVEQFDSFGQTLPLLTRIMIGVSGFLVRYWWVLGITIAGIALASAQILRLQSVRRRADRFVLWLPVLGKLLRDLNAAQMARTLSTMINSRLPLLDGLQLTTPTIRNLVLRDACEGLAQAVRGGGSLSGAMRQADVFPPLLVYLSASGESAGQLGLLLERAADYLEREFDRFTATALALLEPLIIIAMGTIVALIVLSIMLPILHLQSMIGQ
jgi:general secretion pathway protein F